MFGKLKNNNVVEQVEKKKKPFYKRWWFIALIIFVLIGALGSGGEDTADKPDNKETELASKEPATETATKTVNYEVTGNMNVEFIEDKISVTINSNAIDGSIFEILVADGKFNSVSDYITIENGAGTKEFDIPQEWDIGYVSGLATMRFNLEEHPQPKQVKEFYGEVGEKLEGEFTVENNLNGKNITLEIITVPYPNEQAVNEKLDELYYNAMNELIELSNGVIVGISTDNGITNVTISDSWYYSAEHEKERFAEQIGSTIQTILINAGRAKSDDYIPIYFYDTYGKELATPKLLGGYKIKR